MSDYKLNKNNVKEFVENSDKEVVSIVKKIIKNTKYIKNGVFFKHLKKNIKSLFEKIKYHKSIYIFVDEYDKKRSNYWLYTHLKKILKVELIPVNYQSDLSMLKKDDYVIFIDDCIFSGHQLGALIANFQDINKDKIKEKVNLFVLVPFISKEGSDYIKMVFNSNNELKKYKLIFNKYSYKLKLSNKILTTDEIDLMNKYYPRVKIIEDSARHYFNDKYFIYFQHKLADGTSTIPLFYKGLVPNNHNLEILSNYIEGDYQKLMLYPLIKNCKYENNFTGHCPMPPYKK